MIIQATRLQQLSFSKLMQVYIEGNREKAREEYGALGENEGLLQAEQVFYQYLQECFFRTANACYYILEEEGEYLCALRTEPYGDGILISALETAPEYRRQGYAAQLLDFVTSGCLGKVYSHVSKGNIASLKTHEKCGFIILKKSARYLDGSVNSGAYTMCYSANA